MRDNIKNSKLNITGVVNTEASVNMGDWKSGESAAADSSSYDQQKREEKEAEELEKISNSDEDMTQLVWKEEDLTPPDSEGGEKPIEVVIDMVSPPVPGSGSSTWFTPSQHDKETSSFMDTDYLPRFERNVFEHLYTIVADHPNFMRANYINCKYRK